MPGTEKGLCFLNATWTSPTQGEIFSQGALDDHLAISQAIKLVEQLLDHRHRHWFYEPFSLRTMPDQKSPPTASTIIIPSPVRTA
jgi:hypothetical protein